MAMSIVPAALQQVAVHVVDTAGLSLVTSDGIKIAAGSAAIGVVDTELPAAAAGNDGAANATAPAVDDRLSLFNGTTWDRERGNTNVTVFASAARTATPAPFDGTNYNARGLHLVVDVTAAAATPSVVFTIQAKDEISGTFYTVLASAAITGIGTTILRAYPGLTAAANLVASDVLPRTWRVIATHADADSITYSVGASLIL